MQKFAPLYVWEQEKKSTEKKSKKLNMKCERREYEEIENIIFLTLFF